MSELVSIGMKRCSRCGTVDVRTRTVCASCLSDGFEPVDIAGSGRLVSWTTIHRAPTQFRDDVPYTVCVVDLESGPRVTGRLAKTSDPAVGDLVRAIELRGETPIFTSLP